jgi:hypothetical protein
MMAVFTSSFHFPPPISILPLLYTSVSQTFLFPYPFWFRNVSKDPQFLAHVNILWLDDRHPELKIYIPEIILDTCEHAPVTFVTMLCMIWL